MMQSTPVVLVEGRLLQDSFLNAGRQDRAELKAAAERMKKSGGKNFYYIEAKHRFGDDGSHPSDPGLCARLMYSPKSLVRA